MLKENDGVYQSKLEESNKNHTDSESKNNKFTKGEYQSLPDEEKNLINKNTEETNSETNKFSFIDSILESQGYNLNTWKVILLVSLVLMVEGLHMNIFSSMLIPITSYYNLNPSQIQIISGLLFIGVGLGSFVSGSTTVKYGRPIIINIFLLMIIVFHVLMSLTSNYIIFTLCRFLVGFGLGVIVPVSLNLLAEYLPVKNRALVLTGVWTGFPIGGLFLLYSMLWIMPNLEVTKVGYTLLFTSILPLLCLILTFFFLKDSPRNLILMHNEKEAIEQLEAIAGRRLTTIEIQQICYEVRSGTNAELTKSLTEIFSNKFLILTILLSFIWFLNSVVTYGPFLVYTLTMKALGQKSVSSNREIILHQITVTLINVPANILGGIFSELSFLGRKRATYLNFFIALIFGIFLFVFPKHFHVFFGLIEAFVGIAFNISTTYSCEVYPTKIRDQALGYLFFCTRIGGFTSQILYMYFHSIGIWYPYYFTGGFICLNIILVMMLPYETYGQPLDVDHHGLASKKNEKAIIVEAKTL
jgi:AAHS family benzoate transporter-like MFS transporter